MKHSFFKFEERIKYENLQTLQRQFDLRYFSLWLINQLPEDIFLESQHLKKMNDCTKYACLLKESIKNEFFWNDENYSTSQKNLRPACEKLKCSQTSIWLCSINLGNDMFWDGEMFVSFLASVPLESTSVGSLPSSFCASTPNADLWSIPIQTPDIANIVSKWWVGLVSPEPSK